MVVFQMLPLRAMTSPRQARLIWPPVLCVLVLGVLALWTVWAQPAASAEGRKLYMPIGSERLLSFELPFGQISVADPNVIEALPFTQKKLNLIARAFGSTVVLVLGEDGVTTLASYDVQVGPDLAQLKQSLWLLAPKLSSISSTPRFKFKAPFRTPRPKSSSSVLPKK